MVNSCAGLGAECKFSGRVKLVFHLFAGAVSSLPTVCHHVAPQTFVSLAENGEGRMSFGCGVSLTRSWAIFVASVLAPWGKWALL